jgi:hypothetical protein
VPRRVIHALVAAHDAWTVVLLVPGFPVQIRGGVPVEFAWRVASVFVDAEETPDAVRRLTAAGRTAGAKTREMLLERVVVHSTASEGTGVLG